jgi:hypothetical protein
MILVLSSHSDIHANRVESVLRARRAPFVRFDRAEYPSEAAISIRMEHGRRVRRIHRARGDIELDQISTIWHRRPGWPTPFPDLSRDWMKRCIEEDAAPLFSDIWDSFDCPQIPAPRPVYKRAEGKLTNLTLAEELGFEIPPTLVSNDPREVRDFVRSHDGRVISKVTGQTLNNKFLAPDHVRLTDVMTHRDMGYIESVRHMATIFQAYVPKRVELRVTIVGGEVFAAEIHSQVTKHTRHDWRRYDHGNTPMAPHRLPEAEARRCVELTRRLGLCYGTIDYVVTPDGRYVFLEINSNGQFLWVETMTGLPITRAVADLLCASSENHRGNRRSVDATWHTA